MIDKTMGMGFPRIAIAIAIPPLFEDPKYMGLCLYREVGTWEPRS